MKTLAKNWPLQKEMTLQNLSAQGLSDKTKIGRDAIYKYLNMKWRPKPENAFKIARCLDTRYDILFEEVAIKRRVIKTTSQECLDLYINYSKDVVLKDEG